VEALLLDSLTPTFERRERERGAFQSKEKKQCKSILFFYGPRLIILGLFFII
jgi:hypothetical protein